VAVVPPPFQLANAVESRVPGGYAWFRSRVESANAGLPVRASSWWRSPTKNQTVGGQQYSQHLLGFAIDLVYANAQARASGIARMKQLGLWTLDEGDHVHVQLFPAGTLENLGVYRSIGLA